MADYITSLFGGQMYDPQQEALKQQQAFQQSLSQAVTPQQFIATVGSNLGGQLGQGVTRMFGGQTNQEKVAAIMKEVSKYPDPMTRAYEAERLLNAAGLTQQAETMRLRIEDLRKTALSEETTRLQQEQLRNKLSMFPLEQEQARANIASTKAGTAGTEWTTKRSKELFQTDLETAQSRLDSLRFDLENKKDLQPLEKRRLQNQIRLAEFQLQNEQNMAPLKLEEAKARVQGIQQDQQLRSEMNALGPDATEAQVRGVLRKYGNPEAIIKDLNFVKKMDEDAALKRELQAEKSALAREKMAANIQKLPKDAQDKLYGTILVDQSIPRLQKFVDEIDDPEKKLDFSVAATGMAKVAGLFGATTPAQRRVEEIKKEFLKQANALLLLAKGTQTEGDALRAKQQIISDLEKNSNEGVKSALNQLIETQKLVKQANKTYLRVLNIDYDKAVAPPSTGATVTNW